MIGNLKKWKYEELTLPLVINGIELTLTARKKGAELDMHLINFSWDQDIIFSEIIEKAGQIPIPPYLRRESETSDETSYQTVYSKFNGSVAAPTAGLHFTDEVLNKLRARGNELHELTLHVGAGTFRQIKTSDARQHEMHREIFTICTSTLETLATSGSTIIATGTTTLRTLESLYWLGVKLLEGETLPRVLHQWEYTQLPSVFSPRDAFKALYESVLAENLSEYTAETGIMIVPGYEFKVVDGLITNFHQPDSTLLMLVAAFLGEEWRNVYDYALSHEFRFLSYGDSSLLWR
jgi:S-adenosylmethionine:tRNA ribosyltransferase-isomerase